MSSRVSLFVTCIVDELYPQVGMAMADVLERLGYQIDFPEGQTCCGQPAFNSGYRDEARGVARHFLKVFRDAEYIEVAKVEDVGARLERVAAFHDSCHALRELGIKEGPRRLLARVRGLELREVEPPEECCGFGGTFSVKMPEISGAMARTKVDAIVRTGAGVVIGLDASCLLQIRGALTRAGHDIPTLHLAEVLASR